MTTQTNRGGQRKGAGRPKNEYPLRLIKIACTDEELQEIYATVGTRERATRILATTSYDMHVRYLIAYIQAFISHQRNPAFFNLPNIERAEKAWKDANDFNVDIFTTQETTK